MSIHILQRLVLVLLISAPAAGALLPTRTQAEEVFFVLRGNGSVQGDQLLITTNSVEWFTNAPINKAGLMRAEQLPTILNGQSGPPNAAVLGDDLSVVAELRDIRYDTGRAQFTIVLIRGSFKKTSLGMVTMFIDPRDGCTGTMPCN